MDGLFFTDAARRHADAHQPENQLGRPGCAKCPDPTADCAPREECGICGEVLGEYYGCTDPRRPQ